MNKKMFYEILNRRKRLAENGDCEYIEIEKCWNRLTDVLSEDIESTINFILNECSRDDFSFISEVFDLVAENTLSYEFINCLRVIAKKYPDDSVEYAYDSWIDLAEGVINYQMDIRKNGIK